MHVNGVNIQRTKQNIKIQRDKQNIKNTHHKEGEKLYNHYDVMNDVMLIKMKKYAKYISTF